MANLLWYESTMTTVGSRKPTSTEGYTAPEQTSSGRPEPALVLVHRAGQLVDDVQWFTLEGKTVIGRQEERGTISLSEDPKLSWIHAICEPVGAGHMVRDMNSRNGTFVNGQQIFEPKLLNDGDVLRVGSSLLIFRSALPGLFPQKNDFVGAGRVMRDLGAKVRRIARTKSTILLRGETGVGKEVIAQAIHRLSDRPILVVLNCATLERASVESDLFGHEKGAYTDAHRSREGAFRRAHTGTLFLDELGELSLDVQAKLLRVLETGYVIPKGADVGEQVDVRLIAATNRDLDMATRNGSFREDLLARLAKLEVIIPPLRERREDILLLWKHSARKLGLRENLPSLIQRRVPIELSEALLLCSWPRNVRSLEATVESFYIELADPAELVRSLPRQSPAPMPIDKGSMPDPANGPKIAQDGRPSADDRDGWERILRVHKTVSGVARAVGFSRRHARRILQNLGLVPKTEDSESEQE